MSDTYKVDDGMPPYRSRRCEFPATGGVVRGGPFNFLDGSLVIPLGALQPAALRTELATCKAELADCKAKLEKMREAVLSLGQLFWADKYRIQAWITPKTAALDKWNALVTDLQAEEAAKGGT